MPDDQHHTHGHTAESDWNAVCPCCRRRTVWDWAIGRPVPADPSCPDCRPQETP